MQTAISTKPQRIRSVADRIRKLQSRPLAITRAGDPEAKKSYSVHTCYARGFKPSWCACAERVSSSVAHKLIEEGKAEWVQSQKKDGSVYTWRRAIVLTGAANPGIANQCFDVVQIVSERIQIQEAYAAELAAKALERNRKKRQRSIRALILKFRKHLSPEENDRCFDDQEILKALEKDDSDTHLFVESVAGPREVVSRSFDRDDHILEWLGKVSRIGSALKEAQIRYWNIRLAEEGLTLTAGKHFPNAPKGHGLIVTGGYNSAQIEVLEANRESIENGTRQGTAADFVPGPGNAFDGKPILGPGEAPEDFEQSKDYEAQQIAVAQELGLTPEESRQESTLP